MWSRSNRRFIAPRKTARSSRRCAKRPRTANLSPRLVELKARFDEAANIRQSRRLERAGAHVVYGFHRPEDPCQNQHRCAAREGNQLVTYTHYGTGNYHPITARIYTDLSLFTCDQRLGRDATKVFNYLSGYAQPASLEQSGDLSPTTLKPRLLAMIKRPKANMQPLANRPKSGPR